MRFWMGLLVTLALSELLPQSAIRHLDVACGTGFLVKRLRRQGWNATCLQRLLLTAAAVGLDVHYG